MSERFHSVQVILSEDVSDDDIAVLSSAIRQLRNVADVRPVMGTMDSRMAETRAKIELGTKLLEVIQPFFKTG